MKRQQSRKAVKDLAKHQRGKKKDRIAASDFLRYVQALRKTSVEFQAMGMANRSSYGQELIRYYAENAELLRDIGRQFILMSNDDIGHDAVMGIHRPYQIIAFAMFSALADNLTYDEEEAFRLVMAELREAWNFMTGAFLVSRPERMGDVEVLKLNALACVDFIEDFYLGEVVTEISDEFNLHSAYLLKCLEKIGGAR